MSVVVEFKTEDVSALMRDVGRRARAAARIVALSAREAKDAALVAAAKDLRERSAAVLAANAVDVAAAKASGVADAFLDRLILNAARLENLAAGLEAVAALGDPVGEVTAAWERPNGLSIERVRTPLGVIGVIYESRPNVTADAGALCLKAGNAAILRGGTDSFRSSSAIVESIRHGLREAGLPEDAVQLAPTRDRAAVGEMLAGLDGDIDVIVPRGGKGLVARVQAEARVPVFAHLDGNNHVFIAQGAELAMAKSILLNAKMRRTGVCGAAETLLVDRAVAATHLEPLVAMLAEAGCEIRGDDATRAIFSAAKPATDEDWRTEFLDAIIAVRVVDGIDGALDHIASFGSHHTDAIVTDDARLAERFLAEVDSAIVLHNASTQFADGAEFGFGAEIGIATGRLHARGPVGVEQLTSFNYRVRGTGQIRP